MSNLLAIKPMPLETLASRLEGKKLKVIAKRTGLHYNTLRKIRDDEEANPTLNVMRILSDYLRTK